MSINMCKKKGVNKMKKTYEAPVADLLKFDYKDNVVASGGHDASHCFEGRNQGQCASKNANKCDVPRTPGSCTT